MRAVDYHDKSPQSVCSPAGSEETTKSMLPEQKGMSLLWESLYSFFIAETSP